MEAIVLTITLLLLIIVIILVYDVRRASRKLSKRDIPQTNRDVWVLSAGILGGVLLIVNSFMLFGVNSFNDKSAFMGDTIGGVTAPFINGLAAVLVYLALKAQIDANRLIQNQIIKQEKSDRRRDFESSFFQLIKIHNDNVSNMDFKLNLIFDNLQSDFGKQLFEFTERMRNEEKKELLTRGYDEIIHGKDVFKETYLFFEYILSEMLKEEDETKHLEKMKALYGFIYEKLDADYGHYFRGLYRIFKVIDECEPFSDDEIENYRIKYHYSSIVRSQLSDYEIYWLFYNGIYDYGYDKFKPLTEKYGLLKILEGNTYPNIIRFKKIYNHSAFEKPKILV